MVGTCWLALLRVLEQAGPGPRAMDEGGTLFPSERVPTISRVERRVIEASARALASKLAAARNMGIEAAMEVIAYTIVNASFDYFISIFGHYDVHELMFLLGLWHKLVPGKLAAMRADFAAAARPGLSCAAVVALVEVGIVEPRAAVGVLMPCDKPMFEPRAYEAYGISALVRQAMAKTDAGVAQRTFESLMDALGTPTATCIDYAAEVLQSLLTVHVDRSRLQTTSTKMTQIRKKIDVVMRAVEWVVNTNAAAQESITELILSGANAAIQEGICPDLLYRLVVKYSSPASVRNWLVDPPVPVSAGMSRMIKILLPENMWVSMLIVRYDYIFDWFVAAGYTLQWPLIERGRAFLTRAEWTASHARVYTASVLRAWFSKTGPTDVNAADQPRLFKPDGRRIVAVGGNMHYFVPEATRRTVVEKALGMVEVRSSRDGSIADFAKLSGSGYARARALYDRTLRNVVYADWMASSAQPPLSWTIRRIARAQTRCWRYCAARIVQCMNRCATNKRLPVVPVEIAELIIEAMFWVNTPDGRPERCIRNTASARRHRLARAALAL